MRISKSLRAFGLLALLSPLAVHAGSIDSPQCGNPPPMTFGKRAFLGGVPLMQGIPFQYLDLYLTDVQQDKIIALVHPQLPVTWKMEKQRQQLLEELNKLANVDKFDESKGNEIAEKLAALEKDAVFNRAKIDSQIFAILTPEQRKQLSEHKPHPQDDFHKRASQSHMQLKSEAKRII